ncbi:cysteine--tRNA ligase [Candidatus Saganbacteria bacterium CG08_land_8_20_14_0_20_45_16]|uniref:Cysteine--tRNA ligase n=1 Tax=Candidatus Saganbacteria bacterium CG08_land_8_20_14_0_20_45_16 TaxID=2014293 RepID=A0A2H0XY77_UNCSA|nr:MAG: cysteine--tRNA ligase [Candidatus Saganbacteria bacterium CG08_land_8_20_14_0_20_45_16]
MIKIHNTLSNKKEDFLPLNLPNVKMYVCGITPYDETHLGHGRAYVTFDVVRRWLVESGFKVTYVQNITDVDDKIIAKAGAGCQVSGIREVAEKYIQAYFEVMDQLNVQRADKYPKATEHIIEMIKWIESLVVGEFAYVVEGDVYFEVAKFKDYGKLSNRKLDDMKSGARVAVDERKKSPLDFALWKAAKEGEPSWDSPWGKGRPAWHIECSVMSTKYLGEQFDIHGGGLDLVFPHHENEIAQTEAKTHKPWVKYWLHNGFVNINKQKMSKSLGNFFTLKDIFKKFDPMVVRFFLLSTHYRSPINYSDQELDNAKEAYGKIMKFIADVDFIISKTTEHAPSVERKDMAEDFLPYEEKFKAQMDDDFNTAGAIAAIFELIRFCHKTIESGDREKECLTLMKEKVLGLCGVLGMRFDNSKIQTFDSCEIEELIADRETARKNKDFKKSDEIRDKLAKQGIIIEDTAQGTRWTHA